MNTISLRVLSNAPWDHEPGAKGRAGSPLPAEVREAPGGAQRTARPTWRLMERVGFWALLTTGSLLSLAAAPASDASVDLEVARQLNRSFIEIADRVSPSVVILNVTQKAAAAVDDEGFSDSMPPGFWRKFHEQFGRPPAEPGLGQGSGIIIRENGYILTNGHVLEDAESVSVRLRDGRTFKASIRGVDPQSDIGVIKIDARGLPVAALADSTRTRVGEFAIAIGAPFSLDFSVTFGHVSGKGRSNVIEGFEGLAMDQDFIQTDALINPGNSGGPLVNIEGQVIGINTLIRGLRTGIGFAIPSNLAKEVSDQLIAEGKFTRPWLGIGIKAFRDDADLRELIKGIEEGVVVSWIMPDGPAAKSALRPSDIITAVDGQSVATPQQLRTAIRGKKVGAPVTFDVFRQGKIVPVQVSPGERPEPRVAVIKAKAGPAPQAVPTDLGITVKALTAELLFQFGAEASEGVIIASVEKDSPAARNGLKPGDIITSIDQQPIATPNQFEALVKKADLKKGVLVNLVSGNSARFEILKSN